MTTLIQTDTNDGIYNLPCTEIIVQLTNGHKIYLSEGFGGMDSLEGGQYRWRHGVAIRIQGTDTLETLHNTDTTEYNCRSYDRMLAGYDESRPLLEWNGIIVDRIARAALKVRVN